MLQWPSLIITRLKDVVLLANSFLDVYDALIDKNGDLSNFEGFLTPSVGR